MQFSDSEARMLDKLERQHQQWPTHRWVNLAIGFSLFGLDLYYGLDGLEHRVTSLAYTLIVVWTVGRWHGDPTVVLLLKVLKEGRSTPTDAPTSR